MREERNRESVGDEAIYLRVQQLQAGLLQFTDATTAYRMLYEFGKDVRYIAPWKKWIIWNGSQWEVDNKPLIYTKGLEIVRNSERIDPSAGSFCEGCKLDSRA